MHVVQAQHHLDKKAPDGVLRQGAVDLVDQVMEGAPRGKLCHNVQPALHCRGIGQAGTEVHCASGMAHLGLCMPSSQPRGNGKDV